MMFHAFLRLTVFCTLALTSGVLAAPSASSGVAAAAAAKIPADAGARDVAALAARLSVDLSKAPAWEAIPALNLTPIETGEGLPTLQELNLTWQDLLKPVDVSELEREMGLNIGNSTSGSAKTLAKRYEARCYWDDPLPYLDALHCYNYLWNLNTTPCEVGEGLHGARTFCTQGWAYWAGQSANSNSQASYCRDVARGGGWVIDHCFIDHGWISDGANAAHGNGNLIVSVLGTTPP